MLYLIHKHLKVNNPRFLRKLLVGLLNVKFKLLTRFEGTFDASCPCLLNGIDYLRNPKLNKDLAFTLAERQALGIHGLMPPAFVSQEWQLALTRYSLNTLDDDLNKFVFMTELHDRNERLFFRLLTENIEELMPIVYTPTVGLACEKFGLLYRRPRGLFITIHDKGHVYEILKNWPEPTVKAICVTDGERILGLGDLGSFGMGIPVGKLALYTALGGFKPWHTLPITIDVGTNNHNFLEDPLYIGLRQKRPNINEYDELMDEFMEACTKRYTHHVLIQFEDFAATNALRLLNKYRNQYCTFNDDIQGTAAVVVAGLLTATKITGNKLSENTIVFLGAGGAATGIAELCVMTMEIEGISKEEGRNRIWMIDVEGLLNKDRDLDDFRRGYAKNHKPLKTLLEVVKAAKPSVLIGVSTAANAFTPEVLQEMAKNNKTPIIFALSNPTSKAECSAEAAYTNTEGRCIFSSGSPSPPFSYNDKIFKPGQGNNAYIFPGIGLGVVMSRLTHIPEEIFIIAAKTLASMITSEDLKYGSIYPSIKMIPEISLRIAAAIMEYAYRKGMAVTYPEPENKYEYIKKHQYDYSYNYALPIQYNWPKQDESHVLMKSRIEKGFLIKN